jgi:hypothetical protein
MLDFVVATIAGLIAQFKAQWEKKQPTLAPLS